MNAKDCPVRITLKHIAGHWKEDTLLLFSSAMDMAGPVPWTSPICGKSSVIAHWLHAFVHIELAFLSF
jgi:hypothetical protein